MEELEVLESIYLDDIKVNRNDRDFPVSVQLQLHPATGDELDKRYVCMTLMLNIPEQYPNEVPEIVITNPRGLADEEVQSLLQEMEKLSEERVGGEMLYDVIELAKESLTEGNVPYCPCTICCEHFTEDDVFTKTDCYHYFHNQCLRRYIEHQLIVIQREKDGKIQHTEDKEENYKMKCPVCREEINYDLEYLQSEVYNNKKDELVYQPSEDITTWQKNMAELYLKQKEQGGIIDVEAEKNRYLLTDTDNEIQIILMDKKDQESEAQKNKEKEASKSKSSSPFKFNHSQGRGRNDRESRFQNHRYSEKYDHNRPSSGSNHRYGEKYDHNRPSSGSNHRYSEKYDHNRPSSGSNHRYGEKYDHNRPSSGNHGYSRGGFSKPFSGRRPQEKERTDFQRGDNSRSPRNVQSSEEAIRQSAKEDDKCSEKEVRVPVDKCSEKEAKVAGESSTSEKSNINKSKSEKEIIVETEVKIDKKPNSENHKHYDKYDYHRPSSSQRGRQGFHRGGHNRPNLARHGDRDGFRKGNNSNTNKCDIDSGSGYKTNKQSINGNERVEEKSDKGNKEKPPKKSDEIGSSSENPLNDLEKNMADCSVKNSDQDAMKNQHSRIEINDRKKGESNPDRSYKGRGQRRHAGQNDSDKPKGQGHFKDGQNQGFQRKNDSAVKHADQDAEKNQESSKYSNNDPNDRKEGAGNHGQRYKGRGQRRHAGQDYSDKSKGQGHFKDDQNRGYQRKNDYTAGQRDNDYDDAYDNDDYDDYDYYGQNTARRGQGYYRGQRYHNDHRFCEEGFERGKKSTSKKDFKSTSKNIHDGQTHEQSLAKTGASENHSLAKTGTSETQSDNKEGDGQNKISRNSDKNVSHIHSSSLSKSDVPQNNDSPKNCDKTEHISSEKLKHKDRHPPGFRCGPPPGFTNKSTKPPPGFND